MGRHARFAVAWSIAGVASTACADVYTYVGSDNVVVLTNSRPQNQQAEVLVAERAAAVRASAGQGGPSRPRSRYDGIIDSAAQAFGLDGALLHAVIAVESGYNVQARSSRGASGLMQLMPDTARVFGTADVFDPAQNVNGGARYLRYLLDKYDNQLDIVLAAYNAGEKALLKYGRKVPPFKETLRYVEQVQSRYRSNRDARDADAPAGASDRR
ncbi:lytic transglycosylase domain-containing protein [Massilia sp. 2TAF26]|uniref:lytic transglycosylase domain-containing protein n=1 Tax=Massilia sp. 2TAF26 TaxID=3233012 RepID=UPI003F9A6231